MCIGRRALRGNATMENEPSRQVEWQIVYMKRNIVLILDDNLYIGWQVRSNLCYLMCVRHLIR